MSWFAQKLDAFLAAAVIAVAGGLASQVQPFTIQYLQHTATALSEARNHLDDVRDGLRYRVMGDTVRGELETEATARVRSLDGAYNGVLHANPLLRPAAIWRRGEPEIVTSTQSQFVPAMPTTRGSVVFTIIGMIVGFVIYEVVKLPILVLSREPRRRKFRRRG